MFTACGNASKSSETTLSSNDVSISDSTSKVNLMKQLNMSINQRKNC